MGYSPLLLLARGLLVVIIIIRPVLTVLVPRSTLGWLQDMLLRSSLPDFTLEHIYLCLGYIVHLHWSTSHPLHINIDQQVTWIHIHTHAHTLRPLLSMVHPFLCSLRLYHMISRHETFDLEITSEPFVLAFPVFSFITWSDIMANITVQVAERLDGCDLYKTLYHSSTLRFKCQDIIRFPILPTKHNPQALRTGGEIHQYFFGWIDTSRIDVVGRRHLLA